MNPLRLVCRPYALLLLMALAAGSASTSAVASTDAPFAERCVREIIELHQFFEQWSTGSLPDTDEAYGRLGAALAPDFTMVDTDGSTPTRGDVVAGLRGAHGRWPGGGTIAIGEVEVVRQLGDVAVLTYVEHHRFDAGSGQQMSKRRSTVVFRDEPGAPNGVRWLHVHETWIAAPHAVGGEHGHGEHGHGEPTGHGEHGEHGHGEHQTGHGQGFHHDFSDVERWAKVFDDPERVDWQKPEHVVELMQLRPGMRVADLGAGTGFFLGYLSLPVGDQGEVQALDVEASLVQHMRQRVADAGWHNVTARLVATDDPGFEPGSMDRILIVDVWHHVDDRGRYAAKLRDALSADGRVVLVDFDLDSPEGPPKQHRLPPQQVVAELEAGGLKAWVVEDEELPRQYVVMASR